MPNLDLDILQIMHGDTPVRKVYYGDDLVWGSDYIKVDYIENPSTAYIDTNIIPNADTGLKIKVEMTTTSDLYLVGCRTNSGNTRWGIGHNANNQFYWLWGTWGNSSLTKSAGELYLNYYNNQKFTTVDLDTLTESSSALPSLGFTPTYPIRFFGAAGVSSPNCKCKIYYAQITRGVKVVADFVPVYKISTGKYGFLDNISGTFYGSSSSVDFTGPSIS